MIEFKLPSLGSDMDKGKLLEWKVKPGDAVKRGQVVAVVDTSKAAVEVEIWQEGTVCELLTRPGEEIPVATVMATLLEPGEDAATAARRERSVAAPPAVAPQAPISPPGLAPRAGAPAGRKAASPSAAKPLSAATTVG